MRTLDADQLALISSRNTAPIYLIELNLAGQELLSTSGDQTVGSSLYVGGDAAVAGLNNWTSARIRLRASTTRVEQIAATGWRGSVCKIWLLPAVRTPRLVEEGYYASGYAVEGVQTATPILLLDGVLTGGSAKETVELDCVHRAMVARYVPGIRISAPLCNHLPRPGTTFSWDGDTYTIEAR